MEDFESIEKSNKKKILTSKMISLKSRMERVEIHVDDLRKDNQQMNEKLTLVDRLLNLAEMTPKILGGMDMQCPVQTLKRDLNEFLKDVEN